MPYYIILLLSTISSHISNIRLDLLSHDKVEWPQPFATLASIFSISQLNLAEILPAGCISDFSFYDQLLCATLVPIAAGALVHLVSLCGSASLISRGDAIYWSQLIAFCVLPSTSLVLFRVFRCEKFQDNSLWLSADLQFSCESETYSSFLAYTTIMLLVYPIGIPLCKVLICFSHCIHNSQFNSCSLDCFLK